MSGYIVGHDDGVANVVEYATGLAVVAAARLRSKRGRDLTARDAGFDLARVMLGAGFVRPDDLRAVSDAYAGECRLKPRQVWNQFVAAWDAVRYPVGDDTFDQLARAVAGMAGAEVTPHPGPAYLRVALLAWRRQEACGPDADFVFPTTRIEKAFKVHRSSAASAVIALVDRGVLVCTNADYCFRKGIARRFKFVGSVTIGGGS